MQRKDVTMQARRTFLVCSLMVLALTLPACEPLPPPVTPTETPPPTPVTVIPQIPTLNQTSQPGANDLEAAGAPSGGAVPLDVEFPAPDGLTLHGWFYPQAQSAPGVLLLHMLGGAKEDWEGVAAVLQAGGFVVLAVDQRGHGETGGAADWALARQDTLAMLAYLRAQRNVDPARVGIVGASIGANLALNACAEDAQCRAAVLLSPGLDYRGVTTEDAIVALGDRPVLLVASEDDSYSAQTVRALDGLAEGDRQLQMYQNAGHGTRMFSAEPGLTDLITGWLKARL